MKIFGWQADQSACGYYRIQLPLDTAAKDRGWDVGYSSLISPTALTSSDVLIGQRIYMPGPSLTWQTMAAAHHNLDLPLLVYELDDALLDCDPENRGPYREFVDGPNAPGNRLRVLSNIAAADLVIVSTRELARRVRQWLMDTPGSWQDQGMPDIEVVRNTVPVPILGREALPVPRPLIVAWAGSPTHDLDWSIVDRPLSRFLRWYDEDQVELRIYGSLPSTASEYIRDRAKVQPWVDGVADYHRTLQADIVLAPMADTPFNRCKSDLRLLEAGAIGAAIVASDVGSYSGFPGALKVRADHEWGASLRWLVTKHELRRQRACESGKYVNAHRNPSYSGEFVDAIQKALDRKHERA